MRQSRIEAELGHTPLGPCQDREFWHYVLDAAVVQIIPDPRAGMHGAHLGRARVP